jgi:hypothetical protein
MPIKNAVWKVGTKPMRLKESTLSDVKLLERKILPCQPSFPEADQKE